MGATAVLADFIVGAEGAGGEAAALSLLDTRCASAAGRTTAAGRIVASLVEELGEASSPSVDAWAAGSTAAASAMDDAVAYGAAGAPVWSALDALAREAGVDDEARLLEAGSVGIRAALALWRAGSYQQAERGFDGGKVFGVIAAAAAGSRLLGLDRAETVAALALAATQAGGLIASSGTTAGLFHAGEAARDGLVAVKLAASGFSGAPDILEGRQGFGEAFFGLANSRLDRLDEELAGSPPIDEELRSKHVPGHIDHQRTVRALQTILAGVPGREPRSVVVDGVPPASDGNRFHTPATPEQAALSLRYALGCVLEHGTVSLSDYGQARLERPAAVEVEVRSAPRWDRRLEAEDADALRIRVEFADGEAVTAEIGGLPRSASAAELRSKWERTAAELGQAGEAGEILALLQGRSGR